ncbi:hypothetical protein HC028_20330 [Planosporangium flavigriseum]|uniref:Lipoprotein n=1 Tax=Planosporangium flavigriseum TaxID=373681 RepID=A0A8J3LW55_9ACTN|nr:hypothetical protein [Planosporangium flavigriseum]NJC66834.1 hypothetical protein [Planosporangium flavigriseum]GIG74425.1 hypothetical protein Pfl04_28290 [Planosporangium flavigriseum]
MRSLKASIPVLALAAFTASGCAGSSAPPVATTAEQSSQSTAPLDARTQLAGLVAAAKDHRFTAGYSLQQAGRPARTVTVTLAADGAWRVDVPGGALGGQADIALVSNRSGLFQCRTSGAGAACVKAPDASFPGWADPQVQHPFVDWLDPLTDRQSPISVATAPPLTGARGSCFSVEANTVAIAAPVDAGSYCYDVDGTLTAAKAAFGTLLLTTPVTPGPPTIALPAPVTAGPLLPTAAPPPAPATSASPSTK